MRIKFYFSPLLAEIQADVAVCLQLGHAFLQHRKRSNGGIMVWLFKLRCGVLHFCWHSTGQSYRAKLDTNVGWYTFFPQEGALQ